MSRAVSIASLLVALSALSGLVPLSSLRAQATDPDSVFIRAQQMVTAGQGAAGRAVIDSVLAATEVGSLRYAEALFWRASLAQMAADAEKDYLRISIEYPLSPRAPDALLRLAQLEVARNDGEAARAHLERLLRQHPTSPASVRGSVTLTRMAFEAGDLPQACGALAVARATVPKEDVEVRNQLDYFAPRCAGVAAREPGSGEATLPADSAVRDRAATANEPTPSGRATGSAARAEYSVQVAAYDTRTAAAALATRLSARGFAARVVGTQKPYRVRVGRYPTRQRAEDAMRRMRAASVNGVVVQAEPR